MPDEVLLVGLGNPGRRYHGTRHNVGFSVVERLAGPQGQPFRRRRAAGYEVARLTIRGVVCHLVKPQTFMNQSGDLFPRVFRHLGATPDSMIVVYDTLDLPPGASRLKRSGSSGGNNGLASIIAKLGRSFRRVAIGIGRPQHQSDVVSWVLGRPDPDDSLHIERAIDRVVACMPLMVTGQDAAAMNELNRTDAQP